MFRTILRLCLHVCTDICMWCSGHHPAPRAASVSIQLMLGYLSYRSKTKSQTDQSNSPYSATFQYSLHTYDWSVDVMLDEDVVAPCHRWPGHYIFPYTLNLLSVCIEQVFSHTVSISLQLKSSGCVHPLSHGSGYGTLHRALLCNLTLHSAIVRVHSTKG